jgi:polyisoprenoid-binding protein YceI
MGERARLREQEKQADHHAHQRRWLVRTVVGVLVGVGLVVGGPLVYAEYLARHTPDPLALSSSEPEQIPLGPIQVNGTWEVQPGSEAGFRLDETLSGQEVTVVGRTESVSGAVVVLDGMLAEASIVVEVDTMTSEDSARDAFFRRALDTTNFPQARFELSEPVDVSEIGESAARATVVASGMMTMHGVTQAVTATLEVQRTPDGIEVVGQVPVVLSDYGLSAPALGWVVVQPEGTVEIRLLFGG